ncbi:hypothetical protein BC833DRAFT_578534 [Globomyces pollinis-pini]|nr:hypothetical protein BC833DRAFT_578534 [Globomyces pollinis-pini]KAJ3000340.1 hypothetical protein HDV02_006147 [Globomyces sp. JEL0801]
MTNTVITSQFPFQSEYTNQFTWKACPPLHPDTLPLTIDHLHQDNTGISTGETEYMSQFSLKSPSKVKDEEIQTIIKQTTNEAQTGNGLIKKVEWSAPIDTSNKSLDITTSPTKTLQTSPTKTLKESVTEDQKLERERSKSPTKSISISPTRSTSPTKSTQSNVKSQPKPVPIAQPMSENLGQSMKGQVDHSNSTETISNAINKSGINKEKKATIEQKASNIHTEKKSENTKSSNKQSNSDPFIHFQSTKNNEPDKKYTKKPLMGSFGIGNTDPVNHENMMKSFNMKAPTDQIYQNTKEHESRMKEFKENEIKKTLPYQPPPPLPNPSAVLKQYLSAKDLVKQIQLSYKTEYKRQFINWNQPLDKLKEQLANQTLDVGLMSYQNKLDKKENLFPNTAAGLSSLDLRVDSQRYQESQMGRCGKKHKKMKFQGKETIENNFIRQPVDYPKVQSIYHSLKEKAAGVTDTEALSYREKRHYPLLPAKVAWSEDKVTSDANPTSSKSNNETPLKTWELANDTLQRASSRASSILEKK